MKKNNILNLQIFRKKTYIPLFFFSLFPFISPPSCRLGKEEREGKERGKERGRKGKKGNKDIDEWFPDQIFPTNPVPPS